VEVFEKYSIEDTATTIENEQYNHMATSFLLYHSLCKEAENQIINYQITNIVDA
jgi:hypothetical protein